MLNIFKDKKASYSSTAIVGLQIVMIFMIVSVLVLDVFLFVIQRNVVKTQLDYSNRAVYAAVDMNRLARREIYIDEAQGEVLFYDYLKKNLNLNNSLEQTKDRYRITDVRVVDFKIYNEIDLPGMTPQGQVIDSVAVYSRLEVDIQPILFGFAPTVTIRPYLVTDVPDWMLKNFKP